MVFPSSKMKRLETKKEYRQKKKTYQLFTICMGKPVGRWFVQMESRIPIWKFPFGAGVSIWTTYTTYRKSLRRVWHLQNGGWNRRIERDYRCLNSWGITSRLRRRWRFPLNISHCSFHKERSNENWWFLWGCGAVLCDRWVQIALSKSLTCLWVGSCRCNPHRKRELSAAAMLTHPTWRSEKLAYGLELVSNAKW